MFIMEKCVRIFTVLLFLSCQVTHSQISWIHLSVLKGDIESPNEGDQQTCSVVADFNNDGINDFVIGERTKTPSFSLYLRVKDAWGKFVIDNEHRNPEAGALTIDVDGDGDTDIIVGGDYLSNEVWWYENPFPDILPGKPWKRHLIKSSGKTKHHDIFAADLDNDGRMEIVFWNQGANCLYFSRIPDDPTGEWELKKIYEYSNTMEALPRAEYLFNGGNEHEGFALGDIDGDKVPDLIGGGMWFKYQSNDSFIVYPIDPRYHYTRCAAGQLIKKGSPEVVLAVGDGRGPLNMYSYNRKKKQWNVKTIVEEVNNAHSLAIVDFDRDGNMDIWYAEMRLDSGNEKSKNKILFGDGKGNFTRELIISEGIDNHESKIVDLDGDGDLDILGKGYNHISGNVNIWLQDKK